jgi:TolB-like protein
MRKLVSCVLFLGCILLPTQIRADDFQLPQITASLLKGIEQTGKKRIAVVDFVDLDGNTSELGKFIAEELSVELTQSAVGIEVVDRAHLKAILQEHKLKSEGLLDPATTKELGLLAGVDILVTGSITDLGDSVHIVAKALSTDTARIVAASSGTLPKTSEVRALLGSADSSSSSAPSNPAKSMASGQSKDDPAKPTIYFGDFSLAMLGCQHQGAKILCMGNLTNQSSATKRVSFQPSSRMVDDSGTESASDVPYTQYRMTIQVGSDRSDKFCCLDKQIEPGIPINLWFWGVGLSQSATSVSVVLNTSEGAAIIRNIRLISKK